MCKVSKQVLVNFFITCYINLFMAPFYNFLLNCITFFANSSKYNHWRKQEKMKIMAFWENNK